MASPGFAVKINFDTVKGDGSIFFYQCPRRSEYIIAKINDINIAQTFKCADPFFLKYDTVNLHGLLQVNLHLPVFAIRIDVKTYLVPAAYCLGFIVKSVYL